MIYQCDCCGEFHDAWPALAFHTPSYYHQLPPKERKEIAQLSQDFCVIRYPDQVDRFIRVTLTQKVLDSCNDLEYGIWVSLSEASFQDYQTHYHEDDYVTDYFGWLSNLIPGYDDTTRIPVNVRTKAGGQRPEIIPREGHDHSFVRDYYAGITEVEAKRRIEELFKHQRNN